VWAEWAPKNALPTRATGEVKLAAPDLLVEVIVSAAKKVQEHSSPEKFC
jgi:enamine deaminase RidA (YjgF/YER057c/UK114 family)